jgi:Transglutaminase-like superfamily
MTRHAGRIAALRSSRRATRPILTNNTTFATKLRLLIEIVSVYTRVRLRMRQNDLPKLVAFARRTDPSPPPGLHPDSREARWVAVGLGRAVTKTLHALPTDSRCLVQSLVLTRLLAARGLPSSLVIAARSDPDFAAHAWVEYAGVPVLVAGDFADARLLEI